ncbi:MAG: HAMP domain-containing histidine kinase [Christensenellaceae bacterium]|nr:HAMP domain-containing histidine kinase [Christensenellaceae bacterium]
MLPYLLCGALLLAVLTLCVKVYLLHRAMDEIAGQLGELLSTDTNVLLSLSSRDRHARRLAADLNRHLRLMRDLRRRFQSGDRELKEAVTNISHDLRTPLTAICGYLDLLEREDKSPSAERYLALIAGRAEAMKQLTEELFRYSVILSTDSMSLEEADVVALLEESIAGFYGPLTEQGIEPVITLPKHPVLCQADRSLLARVFGNILNNALKYSAGDLEIILTSHGEITFTNTAPGLDEVQVGRLFDRFFTVEAARNSTGLGLAISKALAERMGGDISAEYSSGRLTIRLRLQVH